MKRYDHLRVDEFKASLPYSRPPQNIDRRENIQREHKSHGQYLSEQFRKVEKEYNDINTVSSISSRHGIYMEFKGRQEYELVYESLERTRHNVRLCNVKEIDGTEHAILYIPDNQMEGFFKRIEAYKDKNTNEALMKSIESITLAFVDALWTDRIHMPSETPVECEVWLSVYDEIPADVVERFQNICGEIGIKYGDEFLAFPERAVVAIHANKTNLAELLLRSSNIAEFRRLTTPAAFFIEDNDSLEQKQWMDELLERANFSENSDISVCILDTGVRNAHPLLAPVLKDEHMHTTFNDQIVQDNSSVGHGTEMAGLATYFDLGRLLESDNEFLVNHHLESVRIVDENIEDRKSVV